ncbi:MAG: peptide-methionine (R)-S-oxide reductase MsrB [Verrucomicrobiota bacterium]|nr:peptide-methionine (R)-S-oxide reductase MsrB [Verrucomicrobiota bacterium]
MGSSVMVVLLSLIAVQFLTAKQPTTGTSMTTKPGKVTIRTLDSSGNLSAPTEVDKIIKSEADWKKVLTPEQYKVVRSKGTERPFCGLFHDHKKKGVYTCVACDLPLFTSDAKFDSGTGWPSFFKPIATENILEDHDNTGGMHRVEIMCKRCEGHLGHVFPDGPRPTGLRFCLNSESMKFSETK